MTPPDPTSCLVIGAGRVDDDYLSGTVLPAVRHTRLTLFIWLLTVRHAPASCMGWGSPR